MDFFPQISSYESSLVYLVVSQKKVAPWRMYDNGIIFRQSSGRISWITFVMLLLDFSIIGLTKPRLS